MSSTGKSLKTLWSKMTTPARLSALVLVFAVVGCLAWLITAPPLEDDVFILGILSPDEVRNVEVALGAASLNDFNVVNERRIRVPRDEKAKYLRALQESDAIPDQWSEQTHRWLEGSVFESASVRRSKQEAEREGAFAKFLEALPQIDRAAVDVDQLQGSFGSEKTFVCSIQVQRQGAAVEPRILENIAKHATKHFAGLTLEGVSILDIGTGKLYEPGGSALASSTPLLAAQMAWEDYYRTSVSELLSQYGDVRVGISVQLDPTLRETSQVTKIEPEGIPIETIMNRSTTTFHPATPAQRLASLGTNLPQSLQADEPSADLPESDDASTAETQTHAPRAYIADREDESERTTKQYGQQQTTKQIAGFVPTSRETECRNP